MKCRVTYLGASTDSLAHHMSWHLRCEDGACFLVSWAQFLPDNASFLAGCMCLAFPSDAEGNLVSSLEVACSCEHGPYDALADICNQLGLEMDGDL